jgi:hypothetical protein
MKQNLLEKLTVSQLVKKFSTFYGTRRFITAITTAHNLSLSRARSMQSTSPHVTSGRSILTLTSHLRLRLPSRPFPSGFPAKTLYAPLLCHKHAKSPVHLLFLDVITRITFGETDHQAPRYGVSSSSFISRLSFVQIYSPAPYSRTPSAYFPISV